jgi:hypoxanthine-guanine phosphoribosyltransferase
VRAFELNNGNREYIVRGREGFTADAAAKLFTEHYKGAKLFVATLPLGALKFLGRLSKRFNYVSHIVEALNSYPEKFTSEHTWQELGEPQMSLMDYIRQTK